jgi:hypothetical protein
LHGAVIDETLAAVRDAIASADSEQLQAAEIRLRHILQTGVGQAVSPATLESCHRLLALLRSATDFYAGLAAVMKIQLHGYGNAAGVNQAQAGARFVLEG